MHPAVAVPTFVAWCRLAALSWRRFAHTLPGPFGRRHRLWGKLAFVGLCLSSATGTAMYVMGSRSDPDALPGTVVRDVAM